MNTWFRRATLVALLSAVVTLSGCSRDERREVRVEEEQHEGPVEDTGPGEMVVE